MKRYAMDFYGHVQGGAFRDFCRKQAKKQKVNCTGWIANDAEDAQHLVLEVQGTDEQIEEFLKRAMKGNGTCSVSSFTKKEIPVIEGETDFRVIAKAMVLHA